MHVGVQNVVQRAVLDSDDREQGEGQGELEGWCEVIERVSHDGTDDKQSE